MKISQEKPIFIQGELDVDHLEGEDEVWGKGCDCFSLFCLKWGRFNDTDESDTLLHQRGEKQTEKWWKCKLKQVSEKKAGPKWKNFIRKMSGYCSMRKAQKNRFQYDPYSYALNFDNGADKEGDDLLQDFSSRFAAPFEDDRLRARPGM